MRTKAEKLEKGKWYADEQYPTDTSNFLRFSHMDKLLRAECFSDQKRMKYSADLDGIIGFCANFDPWYIPTPEDIEKYGLIDDETT